MESAIPRDALPPSGMVAIVVRSFRLLARHFFSSFLLGVLWTSLPFVIIGYGAMSEDWAMLALGIMVLYVAYFYWYASIMLRVSYDLIGTRVAWKQILRRLRGTLAPRLFGASMVILALLVLMIVPYVAVVGEASHLHKSPATMDRALGLVILLLSALPPLALFVSLAFTLPVVVLEAVGPGRAMRRSWQLVKGHRWEIGATYVAAILIYVTAGAALHALDPSLDEPSTVDLVIGALSYIAFVPWFINLSVLLYYDLRVRNELLDITSLQRQIT